MEYKDAGFDEHQMREIRLGFKNGLTDAQVSVYANAGFGLGQMVQIRLGFQNGLTDAQVSVYARADFGWFQMEEIRLGYKNGLTDEQVAEYAKEGFGWEQMRQIRKKMEKERPEIVEFKAGDLVRSVSRNETGVVVMDNAIVVEFGEVQKIYQKNGAKSPVHRVDLMLVSELGGEK